MNGHLDTAADHDPDRLYSGLPTREDFHGFPGDRRKYPPWRRGDDCRLQTPDSATKTRALMRVWPNTGSGGVTCHLDQYVAPWTERSTAR